MKIRIIAQDNSLVCRKHARDGGGSGGGVVSVMASWHVITIEQLESPTVAEEAASGLHCPADPALLTSLLSLRLSLSELPPADHGVKGNWRHHGDIKGL